MTKEEKKTVETAKKEIIKSTIVILVVSLLIEFINGFYIGKLYGQFIYPEKSADILIITVGLFIIPAIAFIAGIILMISNHLPATKKDHKKEDK